MAGLIPQRSRKDALEIMNVPLAARKAMINAMVERLATRLTDNPKDLEGWMQLGRAYRVLGRPEEARKAYLSALEHFPDRTARIAPYLENLAAG